MSHKIAAGDSSTFASQLPHGYRNIGKTVDRILWVNAPATFLRQCLGGAGPFSPTGRFPGALLHIWFSHGRPASKLCINFDLRKVVATCYIVRICSSLSKRGTLDAF